MRWIDGGGKDVVLLVHNNIISVVNDINYTHSRRDDKIVYVPVQTNVTQLLS